jgi:hypothetical protein
MCSAQHQLVDSSGVPVIALLFAATPWGPVLTEDTNKRSVYRNVSGGSLSPSCFALQILSAARVFSYCFEVAPVGVLAAWKTASFASFWRNQTLRGGVWGCRCTGSGGDSRPGVCGLPSFGGGESRPNTTAEPRNLARKWRRSLQQQKRTHARERENESERARACVRVREKGRESAESCVGRQDSVRSTFKPAPAGIQCCTSCTFTRQASEIDARQTRAVDYHTRATTTPMQRGEQRGE